MTDRKIPKVVSGGRLVKGRQTVVASSTAVAGSPQDGDRRVVSNGGLVLQIRRAGRWFFGRFLNSGEDPASVVWKRNNGGQ